MQCERLIKQIKSWYIHVQNETMAPARMISFIEDHAQECEICLADPDCKDEIKKITELILPESKIPKAVRAKQEKEAAQAVEEESEIDEEDDEREIDEEVIKDQPDHNLS